MAALLNASRLAGKKMEDLRIVINGAGCRRDLHSKLLLCLGHDASVCTSVKDIFDVRHERNYS